MIKTNEQGMVVEEIPELQELREKLKVCKAYLNLYKSKYLHWKKEHDNLRKEIISLENDLESYKKTIKHSGRKYPLGALHPDDKGNVK